MGTKLGDFGKISSRNVTAGLCKVQFPKSEEIVEKTNIEIL